MEHISVATRIPSRTGLLAMLCQSMIGLNDEDIIADYHESDTMKDGSAAATKMKNNVESQSGKLNRRIFS